VTTPPQHPIAAAAQTPPPGCPAHGLRAEARQPLFDPHSDQTPAELYEQLRQQYGPVAPVLLPGGLEAWLVLGYRECLEVLNSPSRFSSDSRHWSAQKEGRLSADSPLRPVLEWRDLISFADGPRHAELRESVVTGLERFYRHSIRRYVGRHAMALIDTFSAAGEADLVRDYAEKLPVLVLAPQFGVPEEKAPRLGRALRDLVGGGPGAQEANAFVMQTMREVVQAKRKQPGERDLPSWLLQSGMTDEQAEEHLRLVMVAANENTVNALANTLRVVLTDQAFRGDLSGGHMTLPMALHQVLWDHAPLSLIPGRWATGPTQLAGRQIAEGDMVMVAIGAGNHDPAVRTDSVVGNAAHLAFGGGAHRCPGEDIGLSIADTGIDLLLEALEKLELAVPPFELPEDVSLVSTRLTSLPVRFTPRVPAGAAQPAAATPLPPVREEVIQTPPAAAASGWGWWPFRRRRG
jgi:cytochrome P450